MREQKKKKKRENLWIVKFGADEGDEKDMETRLYGKFRLCYPKIKKFCQADGNFSIQSNPLESS